MLLAIVALAAVSSAGAPAPSNQRPSPKTPRKRRRARQWCLRASAEAAPESAVSAEARPSTTEVPLGEEFELEVVVSGPAGDRCGRFPPRHSASRRSFARCPGRRARAPGPPTLIGMSVRSTPSVKWSSRPSSSATGCPIRSTGELAVAAVKMHAPLGAAQVAEGAEARGRASPGVPWHRPGLLRRPGLAPCRQLALIGCPRLAADSPGTTRVPRSPRCPGLDPDIEASGRPRSGSPSQALAERATFAGTTSPSRPSPSDTSSAASERPSWR